MRMVQATSVDDYLEKVPSAADRDALQRVRALIHEEVSGVAESISYGMPTFKANGSMVCIGAFKNHLSFFPGSALDEYEHLVTDYKTSRGTVQFTADRPIPEAVIRTIVQARLGGCER